MSFDAIVAFFAHIPTDWIIIFALAVFFAFDALRSGQARVKALALSLPVALLAYGSLAHSAHLASAMDSVAAPLAQAVLALAIMVAVFLIILRATNTWSTGSQQPISALLSGIAVAAIFVVVWLLIEPLQTIWHFGPAVQAIFGAGYRLWWLLGGYLLLAFVRN